MRGSLARFLIECVLHELLLQPEVLKLLLLLTLALQVRIGVGEPQLAHLLPLCLLDLNIVKDTIASTHFIVVTFAFPLDELIAIIGCFAQALISSRESLIVTLSVVLDGHVGAIAQVTCFSISQVELIIDLLTLVVHIGIAHFAMFLVNIVLPIELILTLLLDSIQRAQCGFLLLPSIFMDLVKRLFGLNCGFVETCFCILLLPLGIFHRRAKLHETLLGMEHIVASLLLLILLNLLLVFLITLVAEPIKFLIMLNSGLTLAFAPLIDLLILAAAPG